MIAPTESFIFTEKTELNANASAGATTLTVKNSSNFTVNDYVLIGRLGDEIAEIVKIATIPGNTSFTCNATKFAHTSDDNITKLLYNQRKLRRDTSRTGEFSTTVQTTDIQVDAPEGTFLNDPAEASTYYYKATYYNSDSGIESSVAKAVAIQGLGSGHYVSIGRIRKESGFEGNDYIGDGDIGYYRDIAENEIKSKIITVYILPLIKVPEIIEGIACRLAAGYLLSRDYGVESDGTSKDGYKMIAEARKILKEIQNKERKLIGVDGVELAQATTDDVAYLEYDSDYEDYGYFFNLRDEHFKGTDPDMPLATTKRGWIDETADSDD